MPRDDSPPAFLFYPDDFAGDSKVEAMTTEGVGCYILLLCKAWRENPPATLPDDDRLLARWARVTDQHWNSLRVEVLSTFDRQTDGRLVQKRLRREYEKQIRNRKARVESGRLGAAERWKGHGTANGDATGEAMAKESENESVSELFERFWKLYPAGRKKSKGKAREAFCKAVRKTDPSEILDAVAEYAASDEGHGQYVKMPATWLNGECWTDDRAAWCDRSDVRPKHIPLSQRGKE